MIPARPYPTFISRHPDPSCSYFGCPVHRMPPCHSQTPHTWKTRFVSMLRGQIHDPGPGGPKVTVGHGTVDLYLNSVVFRGIPKCFQYLETRSYLCDAIPGSMHCSPDMLMRFHYFIKKTIDYDAFSYAGGYIEVANTMFVCESVYEVDATNAYPAWTKFVYSDLMFGFTKKMFDDIALSEFQGVQYIAEQPEQTCFCLEIDEVGWNIRRSSNWFDCVVMTWRDRYVIMAEGHAPLIKNSLCSGVYGLDLKTYGQYFEPGGLAYACGRYSQPLFLRPMIYGELTVKPLFVDSSAPENDATLDYPHLTTRVPRLLDYLDEHYDPHTSEDDSGGDTPEVDYDAEMDDWDDW